MPVAGSWTQRMEEACMACHPMDHLQPSAPFFPPPILYLAASVTSNQLTCASTPCASRPFWSSNACVWILLMFVHFRPKNASQGSRAEQSRRSSDDNWDDRTKRGNHKAVSGAIKQLFTNQTLYFSVEEDLHQPVMTWALNLPCLLFAPSLSTSKHDGRWQQ